MRQLPFDSYRMLTRVLDPFDAITVLDVGASVGNTVRRAVDEFPAARVYALEPEPDSFAELSARAAALPGVRAFNLAASDRAGTAPFHVAAGRQCSSLLRPTALGLEYYPDWQSPAGLVDVRTVAIDDWAPTVGLTRVDVLKIDAQGMELRALASAERLIAAGCVAIDCEAQMAPEYEDACDFLDVALWLRDRGFVLHQVHNMWPCGDELQTTCMDGLWLRRDAWERLRAARGLDIDPSQAGVLHRAMRRCRRLGLRRVAVYGCGKDLADAAPALRDPPVRVVALLDDDPAKAGRELHGVRVRPLADLHPGDVDAVLLNSGAAEEAMLDACAPLDAAGVAIVPLRRFHTRLAGRHPLVLPEHQLPAPTPGAAA